MPAAVTSGPVRSSSSAGSIGYAASPCWLRWARRLWSGLQNDVEGGLGRPAYTRDPRLAQHVGELPFAGLRAESPPDLLRERPWRADDGGQAVVGPADRVDVVFER